MEKVGSDDGATRLPEEYRELEKVLYVTAMLREAFTTINRRLILPKK